jgi:hypothetical protein
VAGREEPIEASAASTHLAALLRELDAHARLTDCTETLDGAWYAVVISRPASIPKSLLLPKELVVAARTNPERLQALLNILRTAWRVDQSRGASDQSRKMLAETKPNVPAAPICPRCSKEIKPGESVRVEHGVMLHVWCELAR